MSGFANALSQGQKGDKGPAIGVARPRGVDDVDRKDFFSKGPLGCLDKRAFPTQGNDQSWNRKGLLGIFIVCPARKKGQFGLVGGQDVNEGQQRDETPIGRGRIENRDQTFFVG